MVAQHNKIFPIFTQRVFSEDDVLEMLPVLQRVTVKTIDEVSEIQKRLQFIPKQEPLYTRVSAEAEKCLEKWSEKMQKLGMEPKGIWEVHFPAQDGAYVWKVVDGKARCGFLKSAIKPKDQTHELAD